MLYEVITKKTLLTIVQVLGELIFPIRQICQLQKFKGLLASRFLPLPC